MDNTVAASNIDKFNETYQTLGRTTIAPDVLINITRLTTLSVHGVTRMSPVPGGVNRFLQRGASEGVRLYVKDGIVSADLFVILDKDTNIKDICRKVQQQVNRAITEMVGMPVGMVNIHVEDIDYSSETEA